MIRARAIVPLAGLAAAYALAVRPRLVRWGATDAEVDGPYPGADLIPGGERSATMAVTIDAPPSAVWPWLVQMGTDRAGWYSWDRLDNWGRASAGRVHPEWQGIALGDRMAGTRDGSQSWEVAALEPERFLGLRMSLDLRGRPFDPRGPRPAPLHRLAVGLPAGGAPRGPHPPGRERLLGPAAALVAAGPERPGAGTLALGHADPAVRQPAAEAPPPRAEAR